jgi:hypothetical protein
MAARRPWVLVDMAVGASWAVLPFWIALILEFVCMLPTGLTLWPAIALFAVLGAPVVTIAWISHGKPLAVACVVCIATYLLVAYVPWTARKAFMLTASRVRPGMSVEEVGHLFRDDKKRVDNTRETSSFPSMLGADDPRHAADRLQSFAWNNTDGRYDADIAEVAYRDGRAIWSAFLPD